MGELVTKLMWACWNQDLVAMTQLLLKGHSPFYINQMGDSAFTFIDLEKPHYLETFILLATFVQHYHSQAVALAADDHGIVMGWDILYSANELDMDIMQRALTYHKFDLVYYMKQLRPLTTKEEYSRLSCFDEHDLDADDIDRKFVLEIQKKQEIKRLEYDTITNEFQSKYSEQMFTDEYLPKLNRLLSVIL